MKKKVVTVICLLTTSSILLSGCSMPWEKKVDSLPLVDSLTKQEVLDYYATARGYDTIVTRTNKVNETTYEEYQLKNEKAEEVKAKQKEVEQALGEQAYDISTMGSVIDKDVYDYVKASIDDLQLSNGTVDEDGVTGALGYYFVDVTYDTKSRSAGSMKGIASLVGVNGAFVEDKLTKEVVLSQAFIESAVNTINNYFTMNGIGRAVTYDDENTFTFIDNAVTSVTPEAPVENTEGADGNDEAGAETDDLFGEDSTADVVGGTVDMEVQSNVTNADRAIKFNIKEFNKIVGSSATSSAQMPALDVVYNIPEKEGDISGFGIYPAGSLGLNTKFGYDTSSSSGEITLRYVFKEDEEGSGEIRNTNVYVKSYKLNDSVTSADEKIVVPEYLMQELENKIERADRVIVNCDLAGIANGLIFDDLGMALKIGYESNSSNILKYMSTIRQVVSRDIENNAYLIEVENTVTEGAKSCDSYGTYKDKYYVVVEQRNTEFIITDMKRTSREIIKEPDINSGNVTAKRLAALNMTGEVSEDTKKDVEKLLNEWYEASTNRILNGPKEVETKDGTKTLERGMYDCFNPDTKLLSSDKKEEMNARARSYLTAHGTDVGATYSGKVIEWIGGADNQVEFIAQEKIEYSNGAEAQNLEVYYLMSSINDKWYIDEMKVLSTDFSGQ